jgi:hypothetical protein
VKTILSFLILRGATGGPLGSGRRGFVSISASGIMGTPNRFVKEKPQDLVVAERETTIC